MNRKNTKHFSKKTPDVFIETGNDRKYKDYIKRHTAVEISLIKRGLGKCITEGKICNAAEGDIFIFSPNEEHIFEFENNNFEILTIHTEPECIWNIGPEFPDSELLKIFFEKGKKSSNRILKGDEISDSLCNLINEAFFEFNQMDKEYVIALKMKVVGIFIILLRKFGALGRKTHTPSRIYNLESLGDAVKYIETNLTSQIDLDMIANSAHLSRSHFCTVFKRFSGISPWDYITIRRIEYSLSLIENTNLSKHEIALKCGFNNSANFYRAFSKVVNAAPGKLI